jgi:hypothetical protein
VFVLYGTSNGLAVAGAQAFEDGIETPDLFGQALAAADFNNDGLTDLAVGAPGYSVGAGLVHVLRGDLSGLTWAGLQQGVWQNDIPHDSAEAGDHFGASLAVGNFDDDAFPDLAIGVPLEGVPSGEFEVTAAGAVHVLFGSAIGVTGSGSQFWTASSAGVPGQAEVGDQFGFSLAAGDFDGDGFDELVIGVTFEENFRGPEEGDVVVLPGTPSGPTATGAAAWNLEVPGILGDMNPGDHLGWSLAIGNFDGDGAQDLAIGIPNDGNIGGVLVLYGDSAPLFADGFESGNLSAWSLHTP